MKHIIILFLLLGFNVNAQKYITKTGTLSFEASVPSFEEVKAENESVTAIINTDNGEIAALALVKGFCVDLCTAIYVGLACEILGSLEVCQLSTTERDLAFDDYATQPYVFLRSIVGSAQGTFYAETT